MTGITSSISNLLSSIVQVFTGLLNTIMSGVQGILAVIVSFIASLGTLAKALVEFLLGK